MLFFRNYIREIQFCIIVGLGINNAYSFNRIESKLNLLKQIDKN
jgi:hypothetical protein